MAAAIRGEHSRGNNDSRADEESAEGELERGRITLEDDAPHGRLEFEGLAEIAAEELLEVVAVLGEEGLIEIEGVTELDDFSWRGAFAEHLLDGIAGDEVNLEEDESEDEPERGKGEEKSLKEVADH